jgi:hypothetical protein
MQVTMLKKLCIEYKNDVDMIKFWNFSKVIFKIFRIIVSGSSFNSQKYNRIKNQGNSFNKQ